MVQLYDRSHATMSTTLEQSDSNDERLRRLLGVLGKCITKLKEHGSPNPDITPVLVHMDCQPQNLICYRSSSGTIAISTVLDWEEAAYADPRFELLLLGRKVCANREQAEVVWQAYELDVQPLGPIEPWLRLETVHSITTLILQWMDLLAGGRKPWETKPDLWGKIEREVDRLILLGWDFCRDTVTA